MFVKLCCCYSIGILLCGALSYLSIKYKREAPQHLRTYFPVGTKAPTDPTNDPFLPKDYKLPRSSTAVLHTLPIIKATITNYTIDQGIVFFKLIVSKDSYPQKKLKKTFGDFEELDQIIESKYVKYLRSGILKKKDLPKKEAYNFNNIQSLEQFKTQLKTYLESFSN
jgi:hypothetical protein